MGEIHSPVRYAEPQRDGLSNNRTPVADESANSTLVNGEEEPYTIKCICGFPDDDGNTVLCEQCNTWQHIECYYPGASVPDVHQCSDCSPRVLDANGATHRQRQLRDALKLSDDRKAKRPGQKSHKKSRTKDANNVSIHTNGWPATDRDQMHGADRKRASPRDQQPPTKRPKTAHRTSGSVNSQVQDLHRPANHRNRSGSNVANSYSPTKSPIIELPPDYFSPEFIRVHQMNTDFTPAQTNLYLEIRVADLLSNCLTDPEAFAAATNGRSAPDVLKRYPQPIEELFTPVRKRVHEDTTQWFHGSHPKWPYLTVERDVVHNSLIGELKGHIGHLEKYKADPVNRWTTLRHPDHFVFFHPVLPIYIDARTEGTELRYVRRSCRPNSRLETIITGERDYHFCFMATADLQEGDEVTIGWNPESYQELFECLSRLSSTSATESEKEYIIGWVEGLLANFGDCACRGQECLMARFDRRISNRSPPSNGRIAKTMKGKRSRKRSSPGIGQAGYSRASSEAHQRGDVDDDADDTRSNTQSTRSRNSRDASPSAQLTNDALENALSERDKRKLQQQEKLFEQLEQEQQGQRKKKRSSGSNMNTPNVATSRQFGHHNFAGSNPTTPAPFGRSRFVDNKTHPYYESPTMQYSNGRSPPNAAFGISRQNTGPRPDSLHITKRPVYVDSCTQTPPEDIEFGARRSPVQRRPYISLTQRLLRRSHLAKLAANCSEDGPTIKLTSNSAVSGSPAGGSLPSAKENTFKKEPSWNSLEVNTKEEDVVMVQYPEPISYEELTELSKPLTEPTMLQTDSRPSHPPIKPPPPPWPSSERQAVVQSATANPAPLSAGSSDVARNASRYTGLVVDLPSPINFAEYGKEVGSVGTPGNSSAPAVHSPMAAETVPFQGPASLTTPSAGGVSGLTHASPVKKKMSLSDYMNKKKVETPTVENGPKLGQPQPEDAVLPAVKSEVQLLGKEGGSSQDIISEIGSSEVSVTRLEGDAVQNQVVT